MMHLCISLQDLNFARYFFISRPAGQNFLLQTEGEVRVEKSAVGMELLPTSLERGEVGK